MALKHQVFKTYLRSSAFVCGFIAFALAFPAGAEVTASDAWVRGTVPTQKTTGAFLTLESTENAKIVGIKSPIAKSAEIHSSEMKDGVMHMHAMDALALPARKRVELKPGGAHVMLMGVDKALGEGDTVPLTFTVEDSRGKRSTFEVKALVRPLGK
jgi:periplasmic copper chaperone A